MSTPAQGSQKPYVDPLSNTPVLSPREVSIRDPLSSLARKERRYLLICGLLAIAVARAGLLPTKITALGIEFSPGDQLVLVRLLLAVMVYFLISFLVCGGADVSAWSALWEKGVREFRKDYKRWEQQQKESGRDDDAIKEEEARLTHMLPRYHVIIMRSTFEFVLPIFFAIVALVVLFRAPAPTPQVTGNVANPVVTTERAGTKAEPPPSSQTNPDLGSKPVFSSAGHAQVAPSRTGLDGTHKATHEPPK
jgi:hypothetical protein